MKENFERHLNMIQKEIDSTKDKLSELIFAMNGGSKGQMFKKTTGLKTMKTKQGFNFGDDGGVIDEVKEFSLSDSDSFGE